MIITPDDHDTIECYVCGNTEGDINAITITKGAGIVGCVFACAGKCAKQMNGAMLNIDQFIMNN